MIIISLFTLLYVRKNIIVIYILIELILLGISILIIHYGILYNNIDSLVMVIVLLIIAGAESTIGLTLLVWYFRQMGSVEFNTYNIS
uniref:NADH dehydrogenase subunit 4L n=1 Tax=Groenewaldozyma salmanticensis TaxID=49332 RepID=E5L085_9ASCO|nr:NADH dehydrogenase subunit 4L [Groenewaldozyma salmanticensis]ADO51050.1 NADH dehydrogenase subunit 4L [Groenewaldozyma salmanticensis]